MLPREWKLRIEDILEAIAKIQHYVHDMTFEAFRSDNKTMDAVARNFEILGEAARHVPTDVQARYPQIRWAAMRAMRNMVAHVYFRTDPAIIWDAIQQDLPPLIPLLQEILEKEP